MNDPSKNSQWSCGYSNVLSNFLLRRRLLSNFFYGSDWGRKRKKRQLEMKQITEFLTCICDQSLAAFNPCSNLSYSYYVTTTQTVQQKRITECPAFLLFCWIHNLEIKILCFLESLSQVKLNNAIFTKSVYVNFLGLVLFPPSLFNFTWSVSIKSNLTLALELNLNDFVSLKIQIPLD